MRRLSGFSLMEMMTVLLIVSIIAAASAPMINKKMMKAASEKSPWVWVGNNGSIAYNLQGNENATAVIGTAVPDNDAKSRLQITSKDGNPHITLRDVTSANPIFWRTIHLANNNLSLFLNNNVDDSLQSVAIGLDSNTNNSSNAIALGHSASATSASVVIGASANAVGDNNVIIGKGAFSHTNMDDNANYATAIGWNARSTADGVAIGSSASVSKLADDGIAIGTSASSSGTGAIAIGKNALTETKAQTIAIGWNAMASGESGIAIGSPSRITDDPHKYGYGYQDENHVTSTVEVKDANGNLVNAIKTHAAGESSVAIGDGARAGGQYSIAIGAEPTTNFSKSIAIGYLATTKGVDSIAIGDSASICTVAENSIAIGTGAECTREGAGTLVDATAIGSNAKAYHTNSTAIGAGAVTSENNQIVLGTENDTVYIPGNLIVGKRAYIGSSLSYKDVALAAQLGWDGQRGFIAYNDGPGFAGRSNIGHTAPEYSNALHYLNSVSDRRLKNVGETFKGGLAELKKLDLFHFTYKKDKSKTPHVGVMAQDLQKVFPDAVSKGDDGFLRIRFEDMFYALINSVKELAGMFDNQDKKIAQLEKENKQLQKTVADLEKRLAKLEKQK